jgi:hypothetical protein
LTSLQGTQAMAKLGLGKGVIPGRDGPLGRPLFGAPGGRTLPLTMSSKKNEAGDPLPAFAMSECLFPTVMISSDTPSGTLQTELGAPLPGKAA